MFEPFKLKIKYFQLFNYLNSKLGKSREQSTQERQIFTQKSSTQSVEKKNRKVRDLKSTIHYMRT